MENVKQKAEWSKKYSPITGASTIILQLIIYAVLLAPALSAQIARSIPAPDIDECSPNPCQNDGTCTDGVDSFTCDCVAGYTGTNCMTG